MDECILIVDDVASNRIVSKARLSAAGYTPALAKNGSTCLDVAKELRPALILLDLTLPDMDGTAAIATLRGAPETHDIPIIATTSENGRQNCIDALRAGADDALVKPYDDALLLARIRNLLRTTQALADWTDERDESPLGLAESTCDYITPPSEKSAALAFAAPTAAARLRSDPANLMRARQTSTLALVSTRGDMALKLRHNLAPLLREKIAIVRPNEVLNHGEVEENVDLFLIDAEGADYERAQRLLTELRCRASTRNAGICLMIDPHHARNASIAFDLGANEVIDSTMSAQEISLRLRLILRRKNRADVARLRLHDGLRLAAIDPLTGLFNRRYALAQLDRISRTAQHTGEGFAILIADLDHFKSVNDQHGHRIGDMVLIEAARRLGSNLRANDLIARVGGEEFLIVLPNTNRETAHVIAQRLCARINCTPLAFVEQHAVSITVSIGVSLWRPDHVLHAAKAPEMAAHIIERADRALLASKAAGRNMVTVSPETV